MSERVYKDRTTEAKAFAERRVLADARADAYKHGHVAGFRTGVKWMLIVVVGACFVTHHVTSWGG